MIQTTMDYNKFKPFFLNRSLQKRNLEVIKQSLMKDNLLSVNPIIVTNEWEILDGGHRHEASRQLNIPLSYLQLPKMDLKELINVLINFNFCLSKWGPFQFLELHCKLEHPEYLKFKKFQDDFKLDIHLALPICRLRDKRRNINEIFRKGDFKFEDHEKIYEITRNSLEFLNTGKESLLFKSKAPYMTKQFFDAYAKTMDLKEFSQTKILHQLSKYGIQLIASPNSTLYYNQLSSLLVKR